MQITIIGPNLPGRTFCRPDGTPMDNVHVGVQARREPSHLVPADTALAKWEVEVDVVERDGTKDFRGPAVQGRPGERFIYLTWGDLGADTAFEVFRRSKLMLNRIDESTVRTALGTGQLVARIDLTGSDGGPRCARVDPPAISWSSRTGWDIAPSADPRTGAWPFGASRYSLEPSRCGWSSSSRSDMSP